jgi:hypothetical protein
MIAVGAVAIMVGLTCGGILFGFCLANYLIGK